MNQHTEKHHENFYLQIILLKLIPPSNNFHQPFKFSINRGKQIFDQTKNLQQNIEGGCISLNRIRLNFIIFAYDSSKSHEFNLMQYEIHGQEQNCIGEFIIDSNAYVNAFLEGNKSAFKQEIHFKNNSQLQIQLYIERTRYSLQKLIREMNNPKSQIGNSRLNATFHRIKETRSRSKDPSVSPRKQRESQSNKSSPKKSKKRLKSPLKEQTKKDQQTKKEPEEINQQLRPQPQINIENPTEKQPVLKTQTFQLIQKPIDTIEHIEVEQHIFQQLKAQKPEPQQEIQLQHQQNSKQTQKLAQQANPPQQQTIPILPIQNPSSQTQQILSSSEQFVPQLVNASQQTNQQQVKDYTVEANIQESFPIEIKPLQIKQDIKVLQSSSKQEQPLQLNHSPPEVERVSEGLKRKQQFPSHIKVYFIVFMFFFLLMSIFFEYEQYPQSPYIEPSLTTLKNSSKSKPKKSSKPKEPIRSKVSKTK